MAAGVLKAVQSGTATIAAGASSGTATITAVTLANTIVDAAYRGSATSYSDQELITTVLTNTTTITFTRGASTGAPDMTIIWYVS